MIWRVGAAAALVWAASGGCTVRDIIANTGDATDGDIDAYCEAGRPLTLSNGRCTRELAETYFDYAVCACDGLDLNGDLHTDSFDSRLPFAPGGKDGDVGSNLSVRANQIMEIKGKLTAGSGGVEAGTTLTVDGNLASGGQLGRSASEIVVSGSAYVGGNVDVEALNVAGTLFTQPGVSVSGVIDADRASAAVAVPPPCQCGDLALEVGPLILENQPFNHNDEVGLDAAGYGNVVGDAAIDLECGRFYLDQLTGSGAGTVVIRALESAVLFIGGNVTLQQDLVVEIAEGAELDLFVGGFVQVAGASRLGDRERPAALRIYVASRGSISLAAGSELAGNLYAPGSDLASSAELEMYGSLVVNHLNSAATVTVHHDVAVADSTCEQ